MKSLAYCPNRRDSAKPAGAFHNSANLNLAKRRLCVALGIRLGSSEHCCAISVARVRAALTASIPRSNRPLARRTNFGAAKSCSLVIIFMIRPPTAQSGDLNDAHRSRPYHGSRNSGDSERPTGAFNSGLGSSWPAIQSTYHRPWRPRIPPCLRYGTRRHRVEALGLALQLRPHAGLAEVQEPGGTGVRRESGVPAIVGPQRSRAGEHRRPRRTMGLHLFARQYRGRM